MQYNFHSTPWSIKMGHLIFDCNSHIPWWILGQKIF